jgi:hypothetical protein
MYVSNNLPFYYDANLFLSALFYYLFFFIFHQHRFSFIFEDKIGVNRNIFNRFQEEMPKGVKEMKTNIKIIKYDTTNGMKIENT